jgi:Flp pilus assembly protein TadG
MRQLTMPEQLTRFLQFGRSLALRFPLHERGMAAVEFSLILPIMVLLWIGGVEVTQGLSVDRRLNNLCSSIGDLVSRTKTITKAQIDQIFDIAPGAIYPYSATSLQMRVTAVKIDGSQNATVTWSRSEGGTAYSKTQNLNAVVPETLRVANSQIIMSEVNYTYTPAVGYVITGSVGMSDRLYFVPRLVDSISCSDC